MCGSEWRLWRAVRKSVTLELQIYRLQILSQTDSAAQTDPSGDRNFGAVEDGKRGWDVPVSSYFLPPLIHGLAPKEYDRRVDAQEWAATPVGIRAMWQDRASRFSFAVLELTLSDRRLVPLPSTTDDGNDRNAGARVLSDAIESVPNIMRMTDTASRLFAVNELVDRRVRVLAELCAKLQSESPP